jgi:putative phosphonate metabolism protein
MPECNRSEARYGIYFAPGTGAALHEAGSCWLGRDAVDGRTLDPRLPAEMQYEPWRRATESPRRYGFHATLKPPFRLAEGATLEELRAALRDFAGKHKAFQAPALKVAKLGRFIALTLAEPDGMLSQLASESVRVFEPFRAPATEQELALRMHNSLSPRERQHVMRWGYPYVFDAWKFHMSLTGPLSPPELPPLETHLRERFEPFSQQPLRVDSVSIFYEPQPGAPFRLIDRVALEAL